MIIRSVGTNRIVEWKRKIETHCKSIDKNIFQSNSNRFSLDDSIIRWRISLHSGNNKKNNDDDKTNWMRKSSLWKLNLIQFYVHHGWEKRKKNYDNKYFHHFIDWFKCVRVCPSNNHSTVLSSFKQISGMREKKL